MIYYPDDFNENLNDLIKKYNKLKEARRWARDLYESKDITKEIEEIEEKIKKKIKK